MTTTRQQMLEAIEKTGEDPRDVVCIWQECIGEDGFRVGSWDDEWLKMPLHRDVPATELPEREYSDDYGGVEGEPVIGFGPKFVYVKGCYDGREWIEAIPRHPESVTLPLPKVGGG